MSDDASLDAATYKAIFDTSPAAVAISRLSSGEFVEANGAFLAMHGYERHELIGHSSVELGLWARDEERAKVLQALRRDGKDLNIEFSFRHKSGRIGQGVGSVRIVQFRGEPHLLGFLTDISELAQARHALRVSERFHESLFENLTMGFAYCRMVYAGDAPVDFVFVEVNPAFETQSGIGGVIGRRLGEVVPGLPESEPEMMRIYGRIARGGPPERFELEVRALQRWFSVSAFCPQAGHFAALFEDVTERRQALDEIERQRELLEERVALRTSELTAANEALARRAREVADLYDHAPCGYHTLGADGTILAANATEMAMLGYAPHEFIGRRIGEFMTPESRALFASRFEHFMRTGRVRDLEYDFVRKDGSLLPVLVNADLVRDEEGRLLGNRATMIDNSARKESDLQIARFQAELARRTEAAEAATAAKSAFLANMSHEIRTPIGAIIGMTHLMRRGGASPEQAQQLERIAAAGAHLLSVVNDILDLSKIEAGRLELDEQDFRLQDLLDRVLAVVGDAVAAKGLGLSVDVAGVPQALHGDSMRLSQALVNFMGNAAKFTEHGAVSLVGRLLEESAAGCLIRFEVRDTGIGIDAAQQARLFAPFEQLDAGRGQRLGGTGLGLAITRRIAEMMGGETGLSSVPGQGSVFWLTARLGRAAAPTAAAGENPEAALRERHRGRRVLLAEDNPVIQVVTVGLLRDVGLEAEAAGNGAQALALAAAGDYAAILMDMQMPVMNGPDAARAIRRLEGRQRVPIVAMTANAFAEDRERCLGAGMNDFLSKPVDPQKLYAMLLRWFEAPPA